MIAHGLQSFQSSFHDFELTDVSLRPPHHSPIARQLQKSQKLSALACYHGPSSSSHAVTDGLAFSLEVTRILQRLASATMGRFTNGHYGHMLLKAIALILSRRDRCTAGPRVRVIDRVMVPSLRRQTVPRPFTGELGNHCESCRNVYIILQQYSLCRWLGLKTDGTLCASRS